MRVVCISYDGLAQLFLLRIHVFQGPGQPSQRVFTGTVTKLHDNFGFVDEDVFFQTGVVKGQAPRVNVRLETV